MQIGNRKRAGVDAHRYDSLAWPRWYVSASSGPRQREREEPDHTSPSWDGTVLTVRWHCARPMACTSLRLSISSTRKTRMSHRIRPTAVEALDSLSAGKASATAGYLACRPSRLGVTSLESARCMQIIRLTSGLPCKKSMNWRWPTGIWATSTGTRWDSFSGKQRKCNRKKIRSPGSWNSVAHSSPKPDNRRSLMKSGATAKSIMPKLPGDAGRNTGEG